MISIAGFVWLDGDDSDPPTLELRLTNGAYVKIGYDLDSNSSEIWYARGKFHEYEYRSSISTGISPDALAPHIEEVERSVRAHASNLRSEWMDDEHHDGWNS